MACINPGMCGGVGTHLPKSEPTGVLSTVTVLDTIYSFHKREMLAIKFGGSCNPNKTFGKASVAPKVKKAYNRIVSYTPLTFPLQCFRTIAHLNKEILTWLFSHIISVLRRFSEYKIKTIMKLSLS